ncbi:hypothetical protein CAMRE0001_1287 [Campylobacter rectus RM3267]|uniref:Uncharacterized protein n=1 Tax=Campylobacter rectus RM3267 TaxID=553218 RepID=B9CZX9_CAMRE|nr:hypothetical protein CAMRE0001_1287 [Campylobacter rectus RM3267]
MHFCAVCGLKLPLKSKNLSPIGQDHIAGLNPLFKISLPSDGQNKQKRRQI